MKYDKNTKSGNRLFDLQIVLNQFACYLMCIWISLPFVRARLGVVFLLLFFGVWLATTDLRWLTKGWSMDLVFVFIFFVSFLPYLITSNLQYGSAGPKLIIVSFPIFFIWIFINHYYMHYKKDAKMLGKIALISIISYTFGSIQTFVGLNLYPTAARSLAGTAWENPSLGNFYMQLGIGGYGYVYSSCFLLLAILYLIINKAQSKEKKGLVFYIFSFIALFIMIIKSSYTILLLITFTGIILVLLLKSKKTFVFFMLLSLVVLLIVPQYLMGELLLKVADLFKYNYILNEKITDLAMNFFQDSQGGQTSRRIELYLSSLNTFLKQPLFGIYGPFGNLDNGNVGEHSAWLDILGYYGLFTGIPLTLLIYFNFKKQIKYYKHSSYYGYLLIIQFLFIMLGTINPVLHVYEIGFVVFFIVPLIPVLVQEKSSIDNLTTKRFK